MTSNTTKGKVALTPEQLAEIDIAHKKMVGDDKYSDKYVEICKKYGCKVIDKRKDPIYEDGDNSSRVGFKYCCYNHDRGKYFQGVLKAVLRAAIGNIHSLLIEKEKVGVERYSDTRLSFLNQFMREFINNNMGNEPGGLYKKDLTNKVTDMVLWFADNDICLRTKLFTLLNIYSDKRVLLVLNEAEEYNNKKFK